jgi:hypothetical protein
VSEAIATAASTIHLFTGNNIGPRGDLASRSLHVRLEVERADPENRGFKHADPIDWTESNRAEILKALYTILLGNPQLSAPKYAAGKTRFKIWWRLVGSAIEHAAAAHAEVEEQAARDRAGAAPAASGADPGRVPSAKGPVSIDFGKLFLSQEEDDEESTTLADALDILAKRWPRRQHFRAKEVLALLKDGTAEAGELYAVLFPDTLFDPATKSSRSVGNQLNTRVDGPVLHGERTLTLRRKRDEKGPAKDAWLYWVEGELDEDQRF